MLARSISGAQQGRRVADGGSNTNSTKETVAGGGGGAMLDRGGVSSSAECRGVSVTSSWPFSFALATAGAGYQQVL